MFSVFTPLAGGGVEDFRNEKEYPYDLNASLDFTRPATGIAFYPTIPACGYIDGLVPLYISESMLTLFAASANQSPWTGDFVGNMETIFPNFQMLPKEPT